MALGCVAIEKAAVDLCYLERLAVLPEARRKGLGRALVDRFLLQARDIGAKQISIGIIADDVELKSWYLDTLGVLDNHRRKGIGEKLVYLTRDKAVENGFSAMSLIAFADNELALPVYKRVGFEVVRKVDLGPNEFIPHEKGSLLLKWEFTA